MSKLNLERHPLTVKSIEILRQLKQGEWIDWIELSRLLGVNAQEEGRRYLKSARDILLREGIVIHAVRNGGLKRFTDADIAEIIPDMRRKKIRSQVRREVKELHASNPANLSPMQQAARSQALAGAGTLLHITNFHFQEAARQKIGGEIPPVPPSING